MNEQDKKTGKRKMPSSPIKAPQGFKGTGKMGQYTGGLTPLVVAPKPGLPERRVAPTIFRGYGIDSKGRRGRG